MEPMEVDDPGGAEATTNALKALLAVLAAQRDPRVLRGAVARLGPADAVVALEAALEALDRGQRDAGLRLLACARGRLDRSSPAVAATFSRFLARPGDAVVGAAVARAFFPNVAPPGAPAVLDCADGAERALEWLARAHDESSGLARLVADFGAACCGEDVLRVGAALDWVLARLSSPRSVADPPSPRVGLLVGALPLLSDADGEAVGLRLMRRLVGPNRVDDEGLFRAARAMARWPAGPANPTAPWVAALATVVATSGRTRALDGFVLACCLGASCRARNLARRPDEGAERDLLGGLDLVETLLAARGTPATAVAVLPHLRCVLKAARTPRRALARTEKLLRAILASFPGIRKDHHDFFRFLRPDAAKDGAAAAAAAAARGAAPPPKRPPGRPPGLRNLGNSCYVNACLRALHATAALRRLLLCGPPARDEAGGAPALTPSKRPLDALPRVTPRLREALALLEGSDRPGLALRSLRGSFRAPYDGADQQDAAEFLHYVLDALEDEADLGGPAVVGDAAKRAAAARELDAVFGGVLETSIECERCGAVSTTRHGVCGKLDVCVPDDGAPRKNEVGCAPREPAAKPASLQDLVRDQYLAEEVLEGDAAYACDACAAKVRATRTRRFDAMPAHLVVSLGRFRYDAATNRRRKVATPVDAPRVLRLPADGRDVAYALYAVVVHAGASPHHGHYYAYATDSDVAASERPPAWSLFDDMDVRPVDAAAPSTPRSAAASPYVLFYARIGGGCPRAGGAPEWRAGLRAFVDADNAAYGRGDDDKPGPAPRGPPPPPRGGAGGAEPFAGGGALGGHWGVS